jgi:hypothetical protein
MSKINLQMLWQGRVKAGHYHRASQWQKTATGTNQSTALQMKGDMIELTTVGSGTGICLPQSDAGMQVTVINAGVNDVQVYTAPEETGSPTIDGTAGTAGVAVAHAPTITIFTCPRAGVWYSK